ncbi:coiled-coil domain-containing protein 190 isoform X2 [Zootoca vivipara]|nr:coiled-coil domain-containing protein 190 [Zootoca vivipara]XP_034979494.1 coiled-coil domain-containing protein 190 isoform X2 [Zootoca vivipara]XP_034979495.1 coiled-coil domain-containing protein 190 isoform X2 [Zootoca vivipara]XP_060132569.1 coiled-coil domain-containing protein 190 isoform X2 [Zootoca vivipara]
MAGGETSRRWEAERQDVKRAEARLIRGLQHLEEARLSYLNSMMKEQRRLQQELMRMQKSRSKQKLSVGPGHRSIKLALPLLSPRAGQDYSRFQDAAQRSKRKTLPKAGGFPGTSQPSLYLQKPDGDVARNEEDRKGHLPPLNVKGQNTIADRDIATLEDSIAKQLCISSEAGEGEEADGIEGQGKGPAEKETRTAGAQGTAATKPVTLRGKRRPSLGHEGLIMDPEAYAADGRLRTMYARPDFLKSYAEARKARYIRHHKNAPAWEKELSLQEIFGHKKTMQHSPQGQAVMKP